MYIPSLSSSWLNIIHFSFSISFRFLSFCFTTLTVFPSTLFYPLALSFSFFLFFRRTITISPFPLFISRRYVSLLSIFLSSIAYHFSPPSSPLFHPVRMQPEHSRVCQVLVRPTGNRRGHVLARVSSLIPLIAPCFPLTKVPVNFVEPRVRNKGTLVKTNLLVGIQIDRPSFRCLLVSFLRFHLALVLHLFEP